MNTYAHADHVRRSAPITACPCCEGSGLVPSASGLSDVPCLCTTLDGNDRIILLGRADTLAWWRREILETSNGQWADVMTAQANRLESTMIHLVAGCEGPCRGNGSREPRCVL